MGMSVEKVQLLKQLLSKSNTDVLGNCMFCEKPIILTKEHIDRDIVDFGLIVQKIYFHLHGSHIQKEIQGFLSCRECSVSPFKLKIAKQLGEIHLDLGKVNENFSKALAKAAAKDQAEKALAEQIKSIEQVNEGEKNEKVSTDS